MKRYFPILKYFVIILELFFIGNIICLWNIGDVLAMEGTEHRIILFLMVQNVIAFAMVGATCFSIWIEQKKIVKASPFHSFIIVANTGKRIWEVFLNGKKSLCFVKKNGKDLVCEEAGQYDSNDFIYAVLNLFEGNWYIETISERYPIGLRRGEETVIYRLKAATSYRLCPSDIIYMDSNKILITESNGLEG